MPISATEAEDQTLYMKRLKYEFDNRTFAYLSMKKAAHVLKDEPAGVFYQAYYDLEVVNQDIYKRSAISLNFDYKANWFTRFRGHAAGFATHLITFSPESLIKVIVPYIPKLEQLRDLADPQVSPSFLCLYRGSGAGSVGSQSDCQGRKGGGRAPRFCERLWMALTLDQDSNGYPCGET